MEVTTKQVLQHINRSIDAGDEKYYSKGVNTEEAVYAYVITDKDEHRCYLEIEGVKYNADNRNKVTIGSESVIIYTWNPFDAMMHRRNVYVMERRGWNYYSDHIKDKSRVVGVNFEDPSLMGGEPEIGDNRPPEYTFAGESIELLTDPEAKVTSIIMEDAGKIPPYIDAERKVVDVRVHELNRTVYDFLLDRTIDTLYVYNVDVSFLSEVTKKLTVKKLGWHPNSIYALSRVVDLAAVERAEVTYEGESVTADMMEQFESLKGLCTSTYTEAKNILGLGVKVEELSILYDDGASGKELYGLVVEYGIKTLEINRMYEGISWDKLNKLILNAAPELEEVDTIKCKELVVGSSLYDMETVKMNHIAAMSTRAGTTVYDNYSGFVARGKSGNNYAELPLATSPKLVSYFEKPNSINLQIFYDTTTISSISVKLTDHGEVSKVDGRLMTSDEGGSLDMLDQLLRMKDVDTSKHDLNNVMAFRSTVEFGEDDGISSRSDDRKVVDLYKMNRKEVLKVRKPLDIGDNTEYQPQKWELKTPKLIMRPRTTGFTLLNLVDIGKNKLRKVVYEYGSEVKVEITLKRKGK